MNTLELLNAIKPTFPYDFFATRSLGILLMISMFDHPSDFGLIRRELGLNASCMSRLMDSLSIKGLAKRERSRFDGRRVFISPTPEGRAFVKQLTETACASSQTQP